MQGEQFFLTPSITTPPPNHMHRIYVLQWQRLEPVPCLCSDLTLNQGSVGITCAMVC